MRWNFRLSLIQHANKATQGDGCNTIFSPIARCALPQGWPESYGKSEHFDATAPGYPKVAEFVDGNERPQHDNSSKQDIEKLHISPLLI
jgi:hypothetical protein